MYFQYFPHIVRMTSNFNVTRVPIQCYLLLRYFYREYTNWNYNINVLSDGSLIFNVKFAVPLV